MRINKTVCDICGKDAEVGDGSTYKVRISSIPIEKDCFNIPGMHPLALDMCEACQKLIFEYIAGLRKESIS